MITLIIFIWLIGLSIISLINLSLLISLWKKFNSFSITIDSSIEDQTNTLLARFQKITSSRLRALDNKIEILDQLIKDADEAYMKSFSMLTDLEKKTDELKRERTNLKIKQEKRRLAEPSSPMKEKHIPKIDYQQREISIGYNRENIEKNYKTHVIEKEIEEEKSPEQILKEKIIEYYDKGMSIQEIAKMLDKGSGEIKLIINLYHKNKK
ncbi:hypothetical protein XO10_00990 [Marinitoga sp. 1135]|uniref:DUF6115 domain-containing protein n=1 Tax=unclassified Marinitoga TaxID=2640159 RepID=UPI001586D172|nr:MULTISPECIES: hypothetical protein [unclassified Marinitoga]NUU94887.1 hypothetical protein [Marinitoga sp. 1135]NUU96825.1 hypothetical protein [Marinitoga sp. 1138]